MTLRRTVLAAVLALAGLAATADRASAQYFTYTAAGVYPSGSYYYNAYSVAPVAAYGYTPGAYAPLGVYSYPAYATYSVYPNYQPGLYGNPMFYGPGWIGRAPHAIAGGWGYAGRW